MSRLRTLFTASIAALLAAGTAYAEPKTVMFYGNSFTLGFGSTRSVNALFEDIAVAAGHEAPTVRSAAASGQALGWHVANNTAPLFVTIPLSEDWDFIVMQEHSSKLTRAFPGTPGYPESVENSKADALALYNIASSRSSGVVPVFYETFARNYGHPFYTGSNPEFPGGPQEMQAEVRAGYEILKNHLNDNIGSDIARVAPVGTAWEIGDYDRLHSADNWHAQNRGTLLAALVIYGTVYEDLTTSDIDLTSVLASVNLTAEDGTQLTSWADSALAIPEPATAGLLLALGAPVLLCRRH
ncbi:hypothetical protein [Mucisphaera sp.]|uniref:hypothetical protein n=1 Tax=Mucisphaera sp. TaxID=2913024 RepID=UPI003D11FF65